MNRIKTLLCAAVCFALIAAMSGCALWESVFGSSEASPEPEPEASASPSPKASAKASPTPKTPKTSPSPSALPESASSPESVLSPEPMSQSLDKMPADAKLGYDYFMKYSERYPNPGGQKRVLGYVGIETVPNPDLRSFYVFNLYNEASDSVERVATFGQELGTNAFYVYNVVDNIFDMISPDGRVAGSAGSGGDGSGGGTPSKSAGTNPRGYSELTYRDAGTPDFNFLVKDGASVETLSGGVNIQNKDWIIMIRNFGEVDAESGAEQDYDKLKKQEPLKHFKPDWTDEGSGRDIAGRSWETRQFSGVSGGKDIESGVFCRVEAGGIEYRVAYGFFGKATKSKLSAVDTIVNSVTILER